MKRSLFFCQAALLPKFALLFCSCPQCWVSGRGVTTSSSSCSSSWRTTRSLRSHARIGSTCSIGTPSSRTLQCAWRSGRWWRASLRRCGTMAIFVKCGHITFLCIPFCGRFLRCKYGDSVPWFRRIRLCVLPWHLHCVGPHGFVSICDVKQDLSFLSCSVTRPAVDAAMVLAPIARARRRACVILANTFLLTIQSFPASSVVSKTCFFSFQARWHCRRCGWRMVRNIVCWYEFLCCWWRRFLHLSGTATVFVSTSCPSWVGADGTTELLNGRSCAGVVASAVQRYWRHDQVAERWRWRRWSGAAALRRHRRLQHCGFGSHCQLCSQDTHWFHFCFYFWTLFPNMRLLRRFRRAGCSSGGEWPLLPEGTGPGLLRRRRAAWTSLLQVWEWKHTLKTHVRFNVHFSKFRSTPQVWTAAAALRLGAAARRHHRCCRSLYHKQACKTQLQFIFFPSHRDKCTFVCFCAGARADQLRARASLVTVVSQDTPPQVNFPLREGTGARCVRAEGSRSLKKRYGPLVNCWGVNVTRRWRCSIILNLFTWRPLRDKGRPAVQAAFVLHTKGREDTHRGLHRQQTASATCENKHTRDPLVFDTEKVSLDFDYPILLSESPEFRCNISSIIPDDVLSSNPTVNHHIITDMIFILVIYTWACQKYKPLNHHPRRSKMMYSPCRPAAYPPCRTHSYCRSPGAQTWGFAGQG